MEEINITYDDCFLEPLTKRILLNLVRNMSEKYINKNLSLDGFYETIQIYIRLQQIREHRNLKEKEY